MTYLRLAALLAGSLLCLVPQDARAESYCQDDAEITLQPPKDGLTVPVRATLRSFVPAEACESFAIVASCDGTRFEAHQSEYAPWNIEEIVLDPTIEAGSACELLVFSLDEPEGSEPVQRRPFSVGGDEPAPLEAPKYLSGRIQSSESAGGTGASNSRT